MANEIANYTDILNKTGLGKSSNVCPNKTNILAISDEININGTYSSSQCVLLSDIEKTIKLMVFSAASGQFATTKPQDSWIVRLTNQNQTWVVTLDSHLYGELFFKDGNGNDVEVNSTNLNGTSDKEIKLFIKDVSTIRDITGNAYLNVSEGSEPPIKMVLDRPVRVMVS